MQLLSCITVAMAICRAELDFREPARGMADMRVRILRAELLAGCQLAVFISLDDGEEAVAEQGDDAQPRTTSTGAVLSVKMSAERNNTMARAIRLGGKVFISRDGSIRPLYPTAHRVRLHPRARITNAPAPLLAVGQQDVLEEHPLARHPTTNDIPNNSILEVIKSFTRTTSASIAPGEAWISMAHGMRAGRMSTSASVLGMFILMGGSEVADYPIVSTAWNASAPFLQHAINVIMCRLTEAADLETEGVLASAKFVVRWLGGIVIVIFGPLMSVIWIFEYIKKRSRSVGNIRKQAVAPQDVSLGNADFPTISMNRRPATGPASEPIQPRPTDASMSGPTSGGASEEEAAAYRSIRQAGQVLFDNNNAIRQMSVKKWTGVGNLKTDVMSGDSLVMTDGAIISAKDDRAELSVC